MTGSPQHIPDGFVASIKKAHALGVERLVENGVDRELIEPVEVALAVEQHRWAWKPSRIRLMLIAESHVFTPPTELAFRIRETYLPQEALHAPREYVRLVYCLGYGQRELLDANEPRSNRGTPQYWKLFGELAGTSPYPRKGLQSVRDRIKWKVETLIVLQKKGVWLLDASLHAVCLQKGARLPQKTVQILHEVWWEEYGEPLCLELQPQLRWCIGGPLFNRLGEKMHCASWIHQPNAHETAISHRSRLAPLLDAVGTLTD